MASELAKLAKRTRASKPRTKSGCLTCKIRHVKCDEQKPECRRCTSTGRKCDGYGQPRPNKSRIPEVQHPAIGSDHRVVLRPGTTEERHYVHFFCTQTTRAFAGIFDSDFWNHFLPQLSQAEPVVRHAVAAVSAVHEGFLVQAGNRTKEIEGNRDAFALQQYNKAIKFLLEYLASPDQKRGLTLITCCLFVCLEMLKGNNKQALDHLEAGLVIFQQQRALDFPAGVVSDLSHLLTRLDIQLSLHGRAMAPRGINGGAEGSPMSAEYDWKDILDARHSLDDLMNTTMRFIRMAGYERTTDRTFLQLRQDMLKRELSAWNARFNRFLKGGRKKFKRAESRVTSLLRVQYMVTLIWMKTCLAGDEMVFDYYKPGFEELVHHAAEFLRPDRGRERKTTCSPPGYFTLEAGIIPPLYYTATKCRDPLVRREAIRLLHTCPQKEGMWHMKLLAKVAELVVAVEEAAWSTIPVEHRIPAVTSRVYDAIMPEAIERSPCQVILRLMPEGPTRGSRTRVEYVEWA
ncbi:Zn(II)2Cys6 transcription factor [Aspergillus neoniger CBS 115656]|uniref:Zn(2)-C6 fungal-type domain-containing protein n=1 Tax=Aspergillus neoniger (strain CBS 115656) TaxID=1448310 RepID=A0A318Y1H9_ASPNB|nr:hypothetical protein BO87DRAFT_322739 [Aspergillus neoniger CBS 115656]PYH28221.1 hypothetical protein BO87DRAFT_322739 [Aspergillus neoniger CBS 115656]